MKGITPQIIGAGVGALFDAYALAFRYVWVAAGCFTVVAVICESCSSHFLILVRGHVLIITSIGSAFLVDPVKEFNMHIDAPAEKDEDIFGPARPLTPSQV